MGNCVITFRSVTPAQRAERLLQMQGIGCRLRRTAGWMEKQGCGYSIHTASGQVEEIVALLRVEKIPFRKVYVQENGRLQELTL